MSTKSLIATIENVGDSGTWEAIASTPTIDRDHEIVAAGALWWNGVTVPCHAEHFGELIGSGIPRYVGDELRIVGRFASTAKAQQVRTLVVEGHMRTMSVMFLPSTFEPGRGDVKRIITRAELLAVDFAPVPSNRDARVLTSRAISRSGDVLIASARRAVALAELQLDLSKGPIRRAVDEGLRRRQLGELLADSRRMTQR